MLIDLRTPDFREGETVFHAESPSIPNSKPKGNTMSQRPSKPTIDISPWPTGEGFQGGGAWWEYVRSQGEAERLDALMLTALLNTEVAGRLLKHDERLFEMFGLSDQTITSLCQIEAISLESFAQLMTTQMGIHSQ
jgi:hypothetical protein